MPSHHTTAALHQAIEQAPTDLAGWLRELNTRELPLMAETTAMLEVLRAIEDQVDAHLLVDELGQDPLFMLKLMRHVAVLCQGRGSTGVETASEALVMLGIGPFFRAFPAQPSVEDHLSPWPAALRGLRTVLHRAHRAARFALAFAVHRQDTDAAVIYQAALLHDLAEMLVWIHAPGLALALESRAERHSTNVSEQALELELLNVHLSDLQQALMANWGMPQLLREISDDQPSGRQQVLNVQLAVRLARHNAAGWDDDRVEEDVHDIAHLLGLARAPCEQLLRNIDS